METSLEALLNPQVKDIQISGIRRLFNLIPNHPGALSLTIGQPDFPTPDHVKEAAKRAIDENQTTYTHNAGTIEVRRAASYFVEQRYGLRYRAEDEIITTNGVSEAIDIVLRAILEPGCEVVLPGPVYPAYEPLIRMALAHPVYVDTRDSDFILTAEKLERHLTDRTRCVILPYPSNPTGCTLPADELRRIADLLRDKNLFIISDEIYSELVYEGEHQSIATFPGMREKTIVVNGLSKSHAMTGWRIGFTFAPAYISNQMLKVHQYNATCASSVSQAAALEALTNGIDDASEMRKVYRDRRDYVCDRLEQMGLEVTRPSGAFYVFPSISKFGLSSWDFAVRMLAEALVAVVPGTAFSETGEGHVRISYAVFIETLAEGLNRMERFVKSLG
ncbi:aminotransferase A [Alicyclobacillus ferrooxydans]|uniref:Aminotransferase n=1 Tax=Alicyclobacillus ferrooxydans TaxID=471514 RepID=A0A0P9CIE0_9BACL|nr:aminotransferase A [Alicyclobacillus ferrooxydans]KPV42798.1 aromatic amino acid aminotransferase [Alicyclobacillus ferrooxydans]